MANVSMSKTKIKKMVEIEEEQKVYTLTVTTEELLALGVVLARVGGNGETSRRKYAQSVFDAIYKQLERESAKPENKLFYQDDATGHISFK